MFTSYYPYGAAIALALDLTLQIRYHTSLDAYMRAMWQRFGKTEVPYTVATMQETLATITDAGFAADFFHKYISGHEPIDYASLLAKAGYELKKTFEGKPSIGIHTNVDQSGKLFIISNTQKGTAAYEGGLDVNDEIIKLDETAVTSTGDLTSFLRLKKPGDSVTITYKHRTTEKKTSIILKEQPILSVIPFEKSGKVLTNDMEKIRATWFSSNIK